MCTWKIQKNKLAYHLWIPTLKYLFINKKRDSITGVQVLFHSKTVFPFHFLFNASGDILRACRYFWRYKNRFWIGWLIFIHPFPSWSTPSALNLIFFLQSRHGKPQFYLQKILNFESQSLLYMKLYIFKFNVWEKSTSTMGRWRVYCKSISTGVVSLLCVYKSTFTLGKSTVCRNSTCL